MMNYQRIYAQMERNRIKAQSEHLTRRYYPRSARSIVVGAWNRFMLKVRRMI